MKYWHIDFDNDNYWLEVDDAGVSIRQMVSLQNGLVKLSCFEDCLAEDLFDPLDMDGVVSEITSMQFEEKWKSQTMEHYEKWESQKSLYAIGQVVNGKALYYYPQGCIARIGEVIGCVYDTDASCKIGDEIQGVVKGYDEQNMWILISIV